MICSAKISAIVDLRSKMRSLSLVISDQRSKCTKFGSNLYKLVTRKIIIPFVRAKRRLEQDQLFKRTSQAMPNFGNSFSRPDPCSVDFGREAPKFRFEFCRGFFGGFFPPIFPRKKAQKNPPKNPPAKFTRDFVRKNSPRISAEAFS